LGAVWVHFGATLCTDCIAFLPDSKAKAFPATMKTDAQMFMWLFFKEKPRLIPFCWFTVLREMLKYLI